ncbi:MAG: FAD-dependent oxidoreductase [Deinococcota bacterium]
MNRETHVDKLKSDSFDVLVIGGGATGAGVALDAATRGLKVAMLERDDFSAGTSSRSTKLIHGGVRYLEKAVKQLDRSQFNLVRDALKERAVLIKIAPHLAKPLAIVTPLYNVLQVPYFLTGLKLYDTLAGKANLAPSRFVDAKEALNRFPMLQPEGLRGAVLYYDGQFDDARMNIALVLTAAEEGATVANHIEVTGLTKDNGKLSGASVHDSLTGDRWDIQAKVVVNATGPFTDGIRHMDDPSAVKMLSASSGVHIILDKSFSPPETGLLIPETEDGRVLFLLPWLDHTLVGTTDNPANIEANPQATEDDIEYILRHLRKYFATPATRENVLSSWSGLRPLVSDPKAADTAQLSRDHVINVSDSGLVTIAGGKWTTYRKMALDTVDEVIKVGGLTVDRGSQTETLKLVGAKRYTPTLASDLQDQFKIDIDVASYLSRAYGDQASDVLAPGHLDRLVEGHPFLEAEVVYAAQHEASRSTRDFLARRIRLGFLDSDATHKAIPKVTDLLGDSLGWDDDKRAQDRTSAEAYFA